MSTFTITNELPSSSSHTYQPQTPLNLCPVDPSLPAAEQPVPLHNRWHPAIPSIGKVKTDQVFNVSCLECTGGQIRNDDSSDDIRALNTHMMHSLSGPIEVTDCQAGDILQVEILDITPLKGYEWGYTGVVPKGFLGDDELPVAKKAIWDFYGKAYATSRHVPGVRVPGMLHPGVIGTAPSRDLLSIWNEREANIDTTELVKSLKKENFKASLPNSDYALLGTLDKTRNDYEKIANEAARTIPGREQGGNCDIKNLTIGSTVYLPVFVDGGMLSIGDLHFSQGDGEVTLCGAIEMAGTVTMKVKIIPDGIKKYMKPIGPSPLNVFPIFHTSTLATITDTQSEFIVFEGQSIDQAGKQWFLDATISFKMAVLNAINFLKKFGYSRDQAYVILGAAPCEARINGIVDVPNCCTTLAVPTRIFNQDIRPTHNGPPFAIEKSPDDDELAR